MTYFLIFALFAFFFPSGHSTRITSFNDCRVAGSPLFVLSDDLSVTGCDFNSNVMEAVFHGNSSCEPSQVWIAASNILNFNVPFLDDPTVLPKVSECKQLDLTSCKYDMHSWCLIENNGDAFQQGPVCIAPPLQIMKLFAKNLALQVKKLHSIIEDNAAECASLISSDRCKANVNCRWSPLNAEDTINHIFVNEQSVTVTTVDFEHILAGGHFRLGFGDANRMENEFTNRISFPAMPYVIKSELEKLSKVDIATVTETQFGKQTSYLICFYATSIDHDSVPLLKVIDTSAVNVSIEIVNIKPNETPIGESISFTKNSLQSPCIVNSEVRKSKIIALGISKKKIQHLDELDSNMARCASGVGEDQASGWNSREECGRVRFLESTNPLERNDTSPTEALGPFAGEQSFCVWREAKDDINSTGNVNASELFSFKWNQSAYHGASGLVRNSQCIVPTVYHSRKILNLFSLSDSELIALQYTGVKKDTNNELAKRLGALVERYERCFEGMETIVKISVPNVFRTWYNIFLFTCFTVSAWYAVVALALAYRMKTLKFLSPNSFFKSILRTAGFAIFGLFAGFILGFSMGFIPAAIMSNIYVSIPINLPFGNAASLGIALGLIILYFDLGRGITLYSKLD